MRKWIALALLLVATTASGEAEQEPPPECVILLHGLWRTELSMLAVKWKLEGAGYTVANVTYPSLTRPIPEMAQIAVDEGLAESRALGFSHFHFVTHSLGGILVRQYLAQHEIEGLGRVVMLGPPNQGSQVADYIHSLEILRPVEPQAIVQLGTGKESVPLQLGPVDFTLGVIAGDFGGLSPLPGHLEGPSDGTVSVEETRVAGMVDFIELGASHTFIMWDSQVLDQVVFFLREGHFDHDAESPSRTPHVGPRR